MNKKTFIAIPNDIKVANEKPILKSEFKKPNNKVRYLIGYNNFIVCTKVRIRVLYTRNQMSSLKNTLNWISIQNLK
jgi:hypothetical protein